ncbi:MAG: hypothetical protein CL768_00115 [Chloroflexi bacterium]|nr:hypothetical protein [Chloroflexota bacterium]
MIYTFEEIMSEHNYASPNEMAGYTLHGGLDGEGNYISPRTWNRWDAINEWSNHLISKGHPLLDCSVEILKYGNYPNFNQAKYLLSLGEGAFLWNSLTITGVIEARGQALAEIVAPDFQEIIKEDISKTATGHMNKGLFVSHGYDEGGDPNSERGAHDQMWFAARDLLFGKDAYPIPEVPENIGRPVEEDDKWPIPIEYAGLVDLLMNVLMIEVRAECFFQFSMNIAACDDLFKDRREDALLAAEMIRRIRQDEAVHVAYLNLIVSELRSFNFKTDQGEILGSEFIDPHWNTMVKWHGEEIHHELKDQRIEIVQDTLKNLDNSEKLIEGFHKLAS